jgi:osmoprotectant transport system ATP-binding protein
MAASLTPMVRLRQVVKRFGASGPAAVDGLDLDIDRGSVVALIGPSGCGKTTTLRMINRLIEPTSGLIEIGGRDTRTIDARALRLGIGYVIQAVGLFPHRTVGDNVAVVPRALGWERTRIRRRVDELVELVGLEREVLTRYPDELSGGQQQRIGVARALAADPPLLLMDEPFGAVDPIVRAHLQGELLDLQARLRKTIVIVTHDVEEAITVADRVALLGPGGRVVQAATPDELLRDPKDASVTAFLGSDPGLRRLALRTVGELTLRRSGVVALGSSREAARRMRAEEGIPCLGVVDGERFVGWADETGLAGEGAVGPEGLESAVVRLGPDATLRTVLDRLVTSSTEAAIIEHEGRFLGLVRMADIRAALVEHGGA